MADKAYSFYLGVAKASTGTSNTARFNVPAGKENAPVHIRGITTAAVQIEGSLDGVNWAIVLASKTADFIGSVPIFPYMRANVTSWTSGNIHVNIWADQQFGA